MCKIISDGVINQLLVETLKNKPGFASKGNAVVYNERVNNSLVKVPVMIESSGHGFRLTAMVYRNVAEADRDNCGEYIHRLNALLWEEGESTGYFSLDMDSGQLTFRVGWNSPGVVNSKAIATVVDEAGHQLCRFGNLLHVAALGGETAGELARRSIACLQL